MSDNFDFVRHNIEHDILLIIVVALFILLATELEGPGLFTAPTPVPIIG